MQALASSTHEPKTPSNGGPLMNDYDLNVVEEALHHPEKQEYVDHFGFTVQVKEDDEYDQDTSDSEFEEALLASTTSTFSQTATCDSIDNANNNSNTEISNVSSGSQKEKDKEAPDSGSSILQSCDSNSSNSSIVDKTVKVFKETSNNGNIEDWQLVVSNNSEMEKLSRIPSDNSTTLSIDSSIIIAPTHKVTGTDTNTAVAATPSYYDMLLSKFTRSGVEQQDSTKQQVKLKEETSHNLKLLKERSKGQDVDWGFWASVISDFDKVKKTEHEKFRQELSIGIPPSLRGMLWQIFSNSKENSELVENEYRELLNKTSSHEKLIRRDLSRTFPTVEYFKEAGGEGQEMLFNVIKAYSLFDSQVGYCQGLHFVVGCLLLHMPDEAAFCVLIKLMSDYGLRGNFTPQMTTLHERMYQFDQLLLTHLPQVHRHLDAQGVLPSMYASQWFMTLFAYRCPLDLVFRVFDLIFVEGSHIVLHFALALMKKNQPHILSLEFESLLEFFSTGSIFEVYAHDPYEFVQDAYTFDISPRHLAKLSKQYYIEAAKEAKLQLVQDSMKRENMELHDQMKKLRNSYKTLEMEHLEVSQQVIHAKMTMASLDAENQQLKHESVLMQTEMTKIRTVMDEDRQVQFEELARQNAGLVDTNSALEHRLSELESVLIDLKLKYAESENDYEVMKQKMFEAQKLSMYYAKEKK